MEWPPEAFWLAVAVAIPSTVVLVSGYRSAVVTELRNEVAALKQKVNELREDNEWLIRQARRFTGEMPPRRHEDET
jgi:cell division protein FtsB